METWKLTPPRPSSLAYKIKIPTNVFIFKNSAGSQQLPWETLEDWNTSQQLKWHHLLVMWIPCTHLNLAE